MVGERSIKNWDSSEWTVRVSGSSALLEAYVLIHFLGDFLVIHRPTSFEQGSR
jgi:hypothetical protein